MTGHSTTCPGPWYVARPPRGACRTAGAKAYSAAGCDRDSADDTHRGALRRVSSAPDSGSVCRRPSVYVGAGVKDIRYGGGGAPFGLAFQASWACCSAVCTRVASAYVGSLGGAAAGHEGMAMWRSDIRLGRYLGGMYVDTSGIHPAVREEYDSYPGS